MLSTIRSCEALVLGQKSPATDGEQQPSLNAIFNTQITQLASALKKNGELTLLFDIEGCLTPLYFVTRTLFPFFDARVEEAAKLVAATAAGPSAGSRRERDGDDAADEARNAALAEVYRGFVEHVNSGGAAAAGSPVTKESLAAALAAASEVEKSTQIASLIAADCRHNSAKNLKVPYFKQLQGVIWREGYESATSELKGHVFSDFVQLLRNPRISAVATVSIFSSGSVAAQKLLLQYSTAGNLTAHIASYHDPVTAGASKQDPVAYRNIKKAIAQQEETQEKPRHIVFFSDSVGELRAAKAAGLTTVLTIRPQNEPTAAQFATEEDAAAVVDASIFSFEQLQQALFGRTFGVSGTSAFASVTADIAAGKYEDVKEERKLF